MLANDVPLFSIVIPLYNRANIIRATLSSVVSQTVSDFEVIVVDDGSADNPAPLVQSLGDPRIRYVRQANSGGGAARNLGIDEARGRYIAFLDSDDIFLPHKLERLSAEIPLGDNEVLYSSMQVDRGVGKYWVRPDRGIGAHEDVGEYLFVQNQLIQTSTIVLPSALARKVKFDGSLRKGQDLDFCLRLQNSGASFRMIDEPLIIWADATETGRTSHMAGYQAILMWLEHCAPLMTNRAKLGYRATVLPYYMGRHQPLVVAQDLWLGLVVGGVPLKIILRQALRAYLPQRSYRRIVNTVVKWAGARAD
jgi:glycosyltransferase involved in cell wall biosynthesis